MAQSILSLEEALAYLRWDADYNDVVADMLPSLYSKIKLSTGQYDWENSTDDNKALVKQTLKLMLTMEIQPDKVTDLLEKQLLKKIKDLDLIAVMEGAKNELPEKL